MLGSLGNERQRRLKERGGRFETSVVDEAKCVDRLPRVTFRLWLRPGVSAGDAAQTRGGIGRGAPGRRRRRILSINNHPATGSKTSQPRCIWPSPSPPTTPLKQHCAAQGSQRSPWLICSLPHATCSPCRAPTQGQNTQTGAPNSYTWPRLSRNTARVPRPSGRRTEQVDVTRSFYQRGTVRVQR